MRHKNSLTLLTYWNELRKNRPAPSRCEIEPAAIASLLPHVFIAEAADGDETRLRLAGTSLCNLAGGELRGTLLADLWLPEMRRRAKRIFAAAAHGTPAVLAVNGLSRGGRVLKAEMVLMPLTGADERLDRIFGSLSLFDPPFWLGYDPLAGFSTTGVRLLEMDRDLPYLTSRAEIGLAEGEPVAVPRVFGRRGASHLSVLDGGRKD